MPLVDKGRKGFNRRNARSYAKRKDKRKDKREADSAKGIAPPSAPKKTGGRCVTAEEAWSYARTQFLYLRRARNAEPWDQASMGSRPSPNWRRKPSGKTLPAVLILSRTSSGDAKKDAKLKDDLGARAHGMLEQIWHRLGFVATYCDTVQAEKIEHEHKAGSAMEGFVQGGIGHALWEYIIRHVLPKIDVLVLMGRSALAVDLKSWRYALAFAAPHLKIVLRYNEASYWILSAKDFTTHLDNPRLFWEKEPRADHPFVYFTRAYAHRQHEQDAKAAEAGRNRHQLILSAAPDAELFAADQDGEACEGAHEVPCPRCAQSLRVRSLLQVASHCQEAHRSGDEPWLSGFKGGRLESILGWLNEWADGAPRRPRRLPRGTGANRRQLGPCRYCGGKEGREEAPADRAGQRRRGHLLLGVRLPLGAPDLCSSPQARPVDVRARGAPPQALPRGGDLPGARVL